MPDGALDLSALVPTEQINPDTTGIDLLPTEEILSLINQADQQVPLAIAPAIPQISQVVDRAVEAFQSGGRLFYVGAGTSGRLGVLDASECPPTFGVTPTLVQGIIAGGDTALRNAVEGAEDSAEMGRHDVLTVDISSRDVLVGVSASGGAAYVVEAVRTARERGAFTAAITCYGESRLAQASDVAITVPVGPEVIAGSTRMKAGTAQKLVLNMISTAAMIRWGKTYRNLMVDVRPTNEKLRKRAIRLVGMLAELSPEAAQAVLDAAQWQVKPAVVMARKQLDYDSACAELAAHGNQLRATLA